MALADSSFAKEIHENEKREWKISKLTHSTLSLAVREVTRTPDLPLRRRSLYPTELRRHIIFVLQLQNIFIIHDNNHFARDFL